MVFNQKKNPRDKFFPVPSAIFDLGLGSGSIKKVAINTWQDRYAPTVNGKRIIRHIYANSFEECEQKLAELIAQMKEEYKLV